MCVRKVMCHGRLLPRLLASTVVVLASTPSGVAQMVAQRPPNPLDRVPRMTVEDLRTRPAGAVLLVDVRDAVAFAAGRLPGAINVPLAEVGRRAAEVIATAGDRRIVTYCACATEHTSATAALLLIERGAVRISALRGGYHEWVRMGGTVERSGTIGRSGRRLPP